MPISQEIASPSDLRDAFTGVSPKRLDESPAALLLSIAVRRYSWRAMLLPSNT
jgi:hypothetical protein